MLHAVFQHDEWAMRKSGIACKEDADTGVLSEGS